MRFVSISNVLNKKQFFILSRGWQYLSSCTLLLYLRIILVYLFLIVVEIEYFYPYLITFSWQKLSFYSLHFYLNLQSTKTFRVVINLDILMLHNLVSAIATLVCLNMDNIMQYGTWGCAFLAPNYLTFTWLYFLAGYLQF